MHGVQAKQGASDRDKERRTRIVLTYMHHLLKQMLLLTCVGLAAGQTVQPHRLQILQLPGNGTVAGQPVFPPPIVGLFDVNGSIIRVHAPMRLVAEYQVVAYAGALTGGAASSASAGNDGQPGTAFIQTRSTIVQLVNGTGNFSDRLVISFASEELRLTFTAEQADGTPLPAPGLPPLVGPPISVLAASPASLVVLHDPAGGLYCQPFGLQPRLAVKDVFNNTVSSVSDLSVRASLGTNAEALAILGNDVAPLAGGLATFASLGVNSSALSFHLRFAVQLPLPLPVPPGTPPLPPDFPPTPPFQPPPQLPPPSLPPPANVSSNNTNSSDVSSNSSNITGSGNFASSFAYPPPDVPSLPPTHPPLSTLLSPVESAAVDCHGPPVRLRLLTNGPLAVEALDARGVRTTAIGGAGLVAFLQHSDGSQVATSSARLSVRGHWQYTHDDDPLFVATQAGVSAVRFVANLTSWLRIPTGSNQTCCELSVPRSSDQGGFPGETVEGLYVPPLAIVRLVARNTGHQGGYGTGDTIEVTFSRKTDRAGFGVGEVLSRSTLDQFLILSEDFGEEPKAYAGVWRDACTLLVIAGNVTGSPTPEIARFAVRLRDDVYELRDEAQRLSLASVASSPTLEGTFGAQQGGHGRSDPLRRYYHELAARRYVPPTSMNLKDYRIGSMPTHRVSPYQADRDRRSECDAEHGDPDGLPGSRPPDALPPYAFDEATNRLIRESVVKLMERAPGLPHTMPPNGLPSRTHLSSSPDARTVNGPSLAPSASPLTLPWTPADREQQLVDRTAAGVVGPAGVVQPYYLTLNERQHRNAFGLER